MTTSSHHIENLKRLFELKLQHVYLASPEVKQEYKERLAIRRELVKDLLSNKLA